MAISAASKGTSHTSCRLRRRRGSATASGIASAAAAGGVGVGSFIGWRVWAQAGGPWRERMPRAASQISRGSKLCEASIVSTTTAPNATAPGPAWMEASDCTWTSAASRVTT